MDHWWVGLNVFWWVVAVAVVILVLLKKIWAHIHIKPVLEWILSRFFPRPHTPKPDLVDFLIVYCSTANSVKFEWEQQAIHLWGKNGGIRERIWERFTSPRTVVIPAGTKEFTGLLPGKIIYVYPAIHAKTGAIDWRKEDAPTRRDYPYNEPIVACTTTVGTGGGGTCNQRTHLIW